jgi:hypothetical protein
MGGYRGDRGGNRGRGDTGKEDIDWEGNAIHMGAGMTVLQITNERISRIRCISNGDKRHRERV